MTLKNDFKFLKRLIVVIFIISFFVCPLMPVQADEYPGGPGILDDVAGTAKDNLRARVLGYLGQTAEQGAGFRSLDVRFVIMRIIQAVLGFVGIIFFILIVYSGFTWMLSRGNEEQIEKSKNVLTGAVTGLAVVLLSYSITFFIVNRLAKALY